MLPDEEIFRWIRRGLKNAGEQYDLNHGIAKKSLNQEPEQTLAAAIMSLEPEHRTGFYIRWRMCGCYPGVDIDPTHGLARE